MEKLTASEFAKLLDGRQYREEITEQEEKLAKDSNLVVVFGISDDTTYFRGPFDETFSSGENQDFYFDKEFKNIFTKESIEITEDIIDRYNLENVLKLSFKISLPNKITQEWCPKDIKTSWRISANFPHETFNIMEDDELYCIGIVFSIDDLK